VIYADQRWIGDHGIGRFARHVLPGLDYHPLKLAWRPSASLDAWRLSLALRSLGRDDLFYSPGYNTPLFCSSRFVFTIHDLSHVYCPENSSPLIRLYYETILRRACHRAARILTVSEFTRKQIIEWSGVSPQKVTNVSCGVDITYRPEGNSYRLPFPYLLCVSNRKPHKNELRIVEAFASSGLTKQMHLVFTGAPTVQLTNCINRNHVRSEVHFVGLIREPELPSLYRGAVALIFPSLYEGFGLPVLEAMACGTPVVTSNVTAMPEVAGDAAILVNPSSVGQIAEAMGRIVNDNSLRSEFREKGLARAAQFSWEVTAARVREILAVTMARTSMNI
jgi:glycosyltransferase involved in cell wall biosynthesis